MSAEQACGGSTAVSVQWLSCYADYNNDISVKPADMRCDS